MQVPAHNENDVTMSSSDSSPAQKKQQRHYRKHTDFVHDMPSKRKRRATEPSATALDADQIHALLGAGGSRGGGATSMHSPSLIAERAGVLRRDVEAPDREDLEGIDVTEPDVEGTRQAQRDYMRAKRDQRKRRRKERRRVPTDAPFPEPLDGAVAGAPEPLTTADQQHVAAVPEREHVSHFLRGMPRNAADGGNGDEAEEGGVVAAWKRMQTHPSEARERLASDMASISTADFERASARSLASTMYELQRNMVTMHDFMYVLGLEMRGVKDTLDSNRMRADAEGVLESVPSTRAVEEQQYLVEPARGERPCVFGAHCEGNFIPGADPITLTEFALPASVETRNAVLPTTSSSTADPQGPRYPCLMCTRAIVQLLFLTARSLHEGSYTEEERAHTDSIVRRVGSISRYYNMTGVVGEYSKYDCICDARYGLVQPVVVHVRPYYTQYTRPDGRRAYRQSGYATVEPSRFSG